MKDTFGFILLIVWALLVVAFMFLPLLVAIFTGNWWFLALFAFWWIPIILAFMFGIAIAKLIAEIFSL